MTTIAYDHKKQQVAFDSRIYASDIIMTDEGVKYIKNSKGMWFLAGATNDYKDLVKLNNNDKVDVELGCSAIFVDNDHSVYVVGTSEGYCYHSPISSSRCIGSGERFALSALDFGKSAKESVEYAMTRDLYTGGEIHVYDIKSGTFL